MSVLIGRRVRELRQLACLSQTQLALRVGIGRPAIARLERGAHQPSMELVLRVEYALGVSAGAVLRWLAAHFAMEWDGHRQKVSTGKVSFDRHGQPLDVTGEQRRELLDDFQNGKLSMGIRGVHKDEGRVLSSFDVLWRQ